jgi:hypothetical protein
MIRAMSSLEAATVRLSVGDRRVPDFFVVGQPKSGTTALVKMLRQHPQIFMANPKEPNFLANDLRPRFRPPALARQPETLDDYLALFATASASQCVGEASVTTYLRSRVAANNIRTLAPRARIIVILREPASLLYSLYLQLRATQDESARSFRRALELEAARRDGRRIPRSASRPQLLLYSEYVRYVEQLSRYHAAFAAEQVLTLIYDDFLRDNAGTIRRVLGFLGVDEDLPIAPIEANRAVWLRSRQLNNLVVALSTGRGPVYGALKAGVRAVTTPALRRSMSAIAWRRLMYSVPRPLDPRLAAELRRRFKPDVEALSNHLGRDLGALWGYESIV